MIENLSNFQQSIHQDIEVQNKKVLVIGFCETATGLGMAVASAIENCIYQTTTREPITEIVLTAGDLDDNSTYRLPFKIKNLYNPTFTQNTI